MVHKNVGADQSNKMLLKLEEDAEVAYNEYDRAVKAEDRAQHYVDLVGFYLIKVIFIHFFFQRKALQAGAVPRTALEQKLNRKRLSHYETKLETRKEIRRQKQEIHEKRVKRRDGYQNDVTERKEKRDNQVYFDGTNYTIRWTCMPRYDFLFLGSSNFRECQRELVLIQYLNRS